MSSPPTPALPWHILGAGSIGGLRAMRLAARGATVTLLARSPAAPQRTLVLVEDGHTTAHLFPQESATAPGAIARLLVATKCQDTREALAPLLPRLSAGTPVVLLQNGMGVEDWLAGERPDLCVLCAITSDGVFRRDHDTLVFAGHGDTLLGAPRAQDAPRAGAIAAELDVTGVTDIQARRWQKLAVNCAINPLTALRRCRNGELLADAAALATLHAVCAEVAAVMRAEGVAADADALYRLAVRTAERTAANRSSMRVDADAGRETEIDFLCGHVVACARRHGLEAPENERLAAAVRALR